MSWEKVVEGFLNERGRRLFRMLTLIGFRVSVIGLLCSIVVGQNNLIKSSPSREEFLTEQRHQSELWKVHKQQCEDLISEWRANYIDTARSVSDIQRTLMQMTLRNNKVLSPREMEKQ